jgi:hypothetical protein
MQQVDPGFATALDYIAMHHNPTPASPLRPIYVGEYGLPFNAYPLQQIQDTVKNVVNTVLSSTIVAYAMVC